jgi:hypothetical protein
MSEQLTDAETKLREAMSCKISVVQSYAPLDARVEPVNDAAGRVRIVFGGITLFLDNFAAELLARELIHVAVKAQYVAEHAAEAQA